MILRLIIEEVHHSLLSASPLKIYLSFAKSSPLCSLMSQENTTPLSSWNQNLLKAISGTITTFGNPSSSKALSKKYLSSPQWLRQNSNKSISCARKTSPLALLPPTVTTWSWLVTFNLFRLRNHTSKGHSSPLLPHLRALWLALKRSI